MVKEVKEIRSLKDFEDFANEFGFAPTLGEIIGKKASEEFIKLIGDAEEGTTWIDVVNVLKKKYNLNSFQCGMVLGFTIAYQSAMMTLNKLIENRIKSATNKI